METISSRPLVRVCAALAGAIGLAAFAGRLVDEPLLSAWSASQLPMSPVCACNLLALAAALALAGCEGLGRRGRAAAAALQAAVFLTGARVLALTALGADTRLAGAAASGWDIFQYQAFWGMGPFTALVCAALALSGFLAGSGPRPARTAGSWLALAAAALSTANLVGHLYGMPLFTSGSAIVMSRPASAAMLLLSCGTLALIGEGCGPLSLLAGASLRARLLRVLLPTAFLTALLNGWLRVVVLPGLHPALQQMLAGLVMAGMIGAAVFVAANTVVRGFEDARLRLQDELRRLQVLFDGSLAGLYILEGGRFRYVNPAFAAIFGYSQAEVMALPSFAELVCEADRPKVAQESSHCTFEGRRKDGSAVVVEVMGSVIESDGARLAIGTLNDVTRRTRQAEEEGQDAVRRQHAQRLESLGVLAGGIAHDFNNLLSGIMGNAELALMDVPAREPLHELLADIRKAAAHAARLTGQLLSYSGKAPAAMKPADLNGLISEMESLFAMSTLKKASIRYELAPDLPPVLMDKAQIQQVVMNLVINGSEAVRSQGGDIRVSTSSLWVGPGTLRGAAVGADALAGEYVRLQVADNGCGMGQSTLARVFEPFFTTKFTGRGLGLSAVLGIVRGHRGAMTVSSAPGQGTVFQVFLPRAAAAPPACGPAGPEPRAGSGRVLVIDDEAGVRRATESMLKRASFSVLSADGGRRGLELFRAHRGRVDLVLLDLTMPEMGGAETLGRLRRLDPEVPVLVTSGYSEAHMGAEMSGGMADGFLQKPFGCEELLCAVRGVLAGAPAS
jgi:PAS domain S-box-containing protein